MQNSPRTRILEGAVALVVLVGVALASILSITPPRAAGADTAPDRFSAARAYAHIEKIGAEWHVAGSPAADDVRRYIVDTLGGLGYQPEVRAGIGDIAALGGRALAAVDNVVLRIPGSASTGQLILMAHYDSVQVSYGANDDGSGTSVLLEVARALHEGPELPNDVILLFTDAEEACLCGAAAFVDSDPLAEAGGVVLNFESRGANGPPVMFETGVGNADLIAQYAAAVPYPVATSMAVEVYRILPNDTDFTPFRLSGNFTGLNSAYIDGVPVYHSPQDRPENVDLGTLQAHGANALALVRQLGAADLGPLAVPASHDATYFPVLGTLVQYPGTLVWPLAILALLAVAFFAWVVRRREGIGWGRIAGGFGLMAVPLAGSAVLAQFYWMLLVALRPGYAEMIDPWQPSYYRLAVCALVATVTIGWYAVWRRRFTPSGLAVGALAWLAVIGMAMAAATPGGSYLAALPALVGSICGVVAVGVSRVRWIRFLMALAAGLVGIVVLVPTVVLFFPALGLATGAAGALMAAMAGLVLLPAFELLHPGLTDSEESPARRRLLSSTPTAVALVAALVMSGVGLAVDGFDEDHPQPTQLMYAWDADTGQAYWVSEQSERGTWLDQYVTGRADLSGQFPFLSGEMLTGPAEAADLAAPGLVVDSDSANGAIRTVTMTIHPRSDARLFQLDAPDITVLSATIDAGGVTQSMGVDEHGFSLLFHGPPADGVTITLTIDGAGPALFRLSDGSDGLDALPGFTPRPAGIGIKGSHTSELLLVARSITV